MVGYARVSTSDQETRLQRDALKRAGVRRVFEEKASGVSTRPQLQQALATMRTGDVLVVWKLDRVARSLPDLLDVLRRLKDSGCAFRSLTEPLDTSTVIGVFMLQMLGAVAQLERGMIRERVIAGQVAAIQRGGRHGRPGLLTDEQAAQAVSWYREGQKKAAIARRLGVARWVVDRVVCLALTPDHPRYAPKRPVLGPLLGAVK